MFRHVVMFRWNDGVDDAQVTALGAALDELPSAISQIVAYHHGSDARVNDGNFDYVVVADFADADGYRAYRDHPRHVALIGDHLAGHVAERAAVQYEFTD